MNTEQIAQNHVNDEFDPQYLKRHCRKVARAYLRLLAEDRAVVREAAASQARIAELEADARWRVLAAESPPAPGLYLAVAGGRVVTAEYGEGAWGTYAVVTHWRPMPAPPCVSAPEVVAGDLHQSISRAIGQGYREVKRWDTRPRSRGWSPERATWNEGVRLVAPDGRSFELSQEVSRWGSHFAHGDVVVREL